MALSATYSGDPANKPIDLVRFLVGDTDCAEALLSDSEIEYLVALRGSGKAAAPEAARAIAGKFARKFDVSTGKVRKALSQRFDHYMRLAKQLEADAVLDAVPWAGGLSVSEKEAARGDADLVQPTFERDQFSNPRAAGDTEFDL